MKCGKHIYVSGLVQGVWYRAFVLKIANELYIYGWARNTDDGRVEIAAFGEENDIKDFLSKLYQGPNGAIVKNVEYEDIPWENILNFDIIY